MYGKRAIAVIASAVCKITVIEVYEFVPSKNTNSEAYTDFFVTCCSFSTAFSKLELKYSCRSFISLLRQTVSILGGASDREITH